MEKNLNCDLPLVSILLAVYKPNEKWLIEQLVSLNNQSYGNLELYVYDDCPECPVDEDLFKKYITQFEYKIVRGQINQGSNKAFEELTKIGNGDYFAYCDQDDIWETDKIEILVYTIKMEKSVLFYSDMSVIDGNGKYKYGTLLEEKPRIKYVYGEKLLKKFFFKNCVSGCCMLVEKNIAQKAVPFSSVLVHDQWICVVASVYGKISFINKPLIKYRIHGNNQTGSLKGISNKSDYYNFRVHTLSTRLEELKRVISIKKSLEQESDECNLNRDLYEIQEFCSARINRNILKIFKYRYLCENEAYFEILIKYMPRWCVKHLLKKLK